jgi:ribosome-binding factor A
MTRGRDRTPGQRQLRVGEELRHALASIFERGQVRDPGLEGVSVTVTEVRMSPDLRNSTVFVMPLGGGDTGPLIDALRRAKPYLRSQVARTVRLKRVPDMDFRPDGSFDYARQVDALLSEPRVARDLQETPRYRDGDDGA